MAAGLAVLFAAYPLEIGVLKTMAKYRVEYSGEVEIEAECELEAECMAATECRPDNCRVVSVEEDETANED